MKSRERFVLPSSEYYNFSPSALSREYLLHVLCVGDFCYAPGYDLQRNSFDSFLMEVILEGSVQIETEGEHFTARAGQVAIMDCNKPHRYFSDAGWHALWAHFDGAAAKGYFSLITRQNGRVFTTHRQREVCDALNSIYQMFHLRKPLSEPQMALHLTQALTALGGTCPAGRHQRPGAPDGSRGDLHQSVHRAGAAGGRAGTNDGAERVPFHSCLSGDRGRHSPAVYHCQPHEPCQVPAENHGVAGGRNWRHGGLLFREHVHRRFPAHPGDSARKYRNGQQT